MTNNLCHLMTKALRDKLLTFHARVPLDNAMHSESFARQADIYYTEIERHRTRYA